MFGRDHLTATPSDHASTPRERATSRPVVSEDDPMGPSSGGHFEDTWFFKTMQDVWFGDDHGWYEQHGGGDEQQHHGGYEQQHGVYEQQQYGGYEQHQYGYEQDHNERHGQDQHEGYGHYLYGWYHQQVEHEGYQYDQYEQGGYVQGGYVHGEHPQCEQDVYGIYMSNHGGLLQPTTILAIAPHVHSIPPPQIKLYATADKAEAAIHEWSLNHGYNVSRLQKTAVKRFFGCDRHGRPRNNHKLSDEDRKLWMRATKKTGCKMRIKTKYDPKTGKWAIVYTQSLNAP